MRSPPKVNHAADVYDLQMSTADINHTPYAVGSAIISIALLTTTAIVSWNIYQFEQRAITTTAEVLGWSRSAGTTTTGSSRGSSPTFRPTLRFSLDNTEHTVITRQGDEDWHFKRGSIINILVDPADPGSARPDTFPGPWIIPMFTAPIGLVFGLGIFAIIWHSKVPQVPHIPANSTNTPTS